MDKCDDDNLFFFIILFQEIDIERGREGGVLFTINTISRLISNQHFY